MASSPDEAPAGMGDQSSPPAEAAASPPPPPPPPQDAATPPPAESPPNSPPPPESPPPATPKSPPPATPVSPPPSSPTPSPPTSSPPPTPTSSPPPPSAPSNSPSPPPPSLTPPQSQNPPPATTSSPPPPATTSPPPPAPAITTPPPPTGVPKPVPPSRSPTPPSLPRSAGVGRSPPSSIEPNSSSNSNDGAIIGGIVAGGVVILAVVIICLMCLRKKKKPKYYMDPLPPTKAGEQYYNGLNQWNNPHADQVVKIPPPPGFMGTPLGVGVGVGVGIGGGWGAPPPPPQVNTSSEFSSNYSGQHPTPMIAPSPIGGGMTQFTYEELAAMSGGFSQANLLGQGGFGLVHKGILPDKREVAIKSLKAGSGQGEREFQAEVEIISRVHHRHLVSLVGYCIANEQRLLVYEFVPNKTLEFHLHGKGQPVMDWGTRLRIAVGSAKGLAYLHEDCHPRIIHRDIKAANILLDYNFEAMVADFGLAKLTSDNYTHVSTRVMGTFGYLAPEYASSGKLTEKSDVFSFGVMLLELITGRRPVDLTNKMMEDSLVDWARPLLAKATENNDYSELIDPRLEDNYVADELARMVFCAGASIRHSARRRPRMSQIVRALEGDSSLDDFNEGVKPGQSAAYNPTGHTEAYDTKVYNADLIKFRKMVMTSKELNSSEYGTTSEYGLNPSSSSDEMEGVSREVKRL